MEKIEKLLKIEFDCKPFDSDDDKYIKTKMKICNGIVNTNFQDKKMPKEKALCKRLSIIMLDPVITANKKYYPQTLLEECKYVQEKTKMENLTDVNLGKSKSEEFNSDSNNETEFDHE